jgi:hypothetical protein
MLAWLLRYARARVVLLTLFVLAVTLKFVRSRIIKRDSDQGKLIKVGVDDKTGQSPHAAETGPSPTLTITTASRPANCSSGSDSSSTQQRPQYHPQRSTSAFSITTTAKPSSAVAVAAGTAEPATPAATTAQDAGKAESPTKAVRLEATLEVAGPGSSNDIRTPGPLHSFDDPVSGLDGSSDDLTLHPGKVSPTSWLPVDDSASDDDDDDGVPFF